MSNPNWKLNLIKARALASAIREAIYHVESGERYARECDAEGFGDLLLIKHELQMLASKAERPADD